MRTIVLLLLGLSASALARADDRLFDRRVPADPHGTVEISDVSGRIDVTGWDGKEVDVHGDLGPGADRIDVESDHGRTTIKVIVPNHSFRSVSTDLRVRVPRESELDVSGVSADVVVSDVQGVLQLKTVSGNIKADFFQHNAEIKTVSGDIALRGRAGSDGAGLHITTISGNVRVDHGSADVEASSVSGDLHLRLDSTHSVRARTTSGEFGFEGKLTHGGSIEGETISGDVTVRAIPDGGYEYEVNTFSGDIKDCMGVEAERVSKYGPGRRLSGSDGQAGSQGGRIRLKTMSGDVELCDRS